jgi:hypothetical protein
MSNFEGYQGVPETVKEVFIDQGHLCIGIGDLDGRYDEDSRHCPRSTVMMTCEEAEAEDLVTLSPEGRRIIVLSNQDANRVIEAIHVRAGSMVEVFANEMGEILGVRPWRDNDFEEDGSDKPSPRNSLPSPTPVPSDNSPTILA